MAEKYIGLKSAIIDNEKLLGGPLYKSIADLASEFEVNPLVIRQLRYRMGFAGQHGGKRTRIRDPRQTPASSTLIPEVTSTEGLLKILADEPLMSSLDRLRILSRLIRTGAPAIKLSAIKLAEELSRVTTERVGPPDPLTEDEAVARLARLLIAIGQPITNKALEVAFGSPEEAQPPQGEPETPLQPDPAPILADVEEPERAVPDLQDVPPASGGPQPPDQPG